MAELIRPAEYARRRGVSEAAVSKAIRRCSIPLVDGKLDPAVADVLWKLRTDPDQARRALAQNMKASDQDGPRDDNWRLRKDAAEARIAEIELAEREGTLVRAEDAERRMRRIGSALAQQMDTIPDRIAAEFGADDATRRKIRQRLREEIDHIRAELAAAALLPDQ